MMTRKEKAKLLRRCHADPNWAANYIEELKDKVISLQEEIKDLEEARDWAYEHGRNCDCIECKVP